MRQSLRLSVALLVSAVSASLLVAQQPPRQEPRPALRPTPQGQAAPRQTARRDRGAASMLLSLRGPLELTADQVKQLEGMQAAPRGQRNGSDALRARADMMDAMRGDGDLTKARAALDKMSRGRNDAVIARLKERQDVRNVLTTAQKAKLDNMRGNRRGMMRGRMRQGMRQGMEARMRMQRGPGMGQGFRSGGRQGMGGGNAPRGRDMEREVFIERRPPVPPLDSLDIR